MFDDLDRTHHSSELQRLLGHYAQAGAADREAWQDRLMYLEGAEPQELGRLHGELLAWGWLEQNTSSASAPTPGVVARCYRITAAGLRTLRQPIAPVEDYEVAGPASDDIAPQPERGKRRKV